MGIKTVPHSPYSPDLGPCDFFLFLKLRGCRYERIAEIKEAVTKVIDTLTQEDFHGTSQKLLERYNKCIAAGGDNFKCLVSIKVPILKILETYLMILVCFFYQTFCVLRVFLLSASQQFPILSTIMPSLERNLKYEPGDLMWCNG